MNLLRETVTIDGEVRHADREVVALLMASRRRMIKAEAQLSMIADDLPIDIDEVYPA